MDQIALNWLVLTLTDSAVYLGIINLCRSLPIMLFTLVGGAVADRVERRRLLIVTQTIAMLLAVCLGVLAQVQGSIWLVLLVATGRGIMMSFNLPARQALISQLVPPEDLMAAISINSAALNLSKVIGPAVGGILIAIIGVAGAFYINAASFVAVILALFTLGAMPPPAGIRESVLTSVRSGVAYAVRDPIVRPLLIAAIVPLMLVQAYQTMTAVFARDVYQAGTVGLGLLNSAGGIGSVVGALAVGSIAGGGIRRGSLMFGGLFASGCAMIAWALAPSLPFGMLALLAIGAGSTGFLASNNSLLQLHAPDEMRGRVLSMMFLTRGVVPFGSLVAGFGAEAIGAPATIALFGITIMVLAAVSAYSAPTVRRLA